MLYHWAIEARWYVRHKAIGLANNGSIQQTCFTFNQGSKTITLIVYIDWLLEITWYKLVYAVFQVCLLKCWQLYISLIVICKRSDCDVVGCSPAQDACPGFCDCTCTIYLNLVLTKGQFRLWSTYLRSSIHLSYAVLSDCNKLCQFHKHTNLDEDKLDCQDNKLWDLFLLSLRWYIKQNCYQELYMSICFVCSSLTPSNSC